MPRVKADENLWGGLAWFSGVVALVRPPAAVISFLLPVPLRAQLDLEFSDEPAHPLVFLFGELRDGGAHVGGRDFSLGIRYLEAAVMVPQVRHCAHDFDTLFACEMFADDSRAILLGNAAYGFRKRRSLIEWSGSSYTVQTQGEERLVAQGALHGTWGPARPGSGYDWLENLSSSPVLGRRVTGEYVLSSFSWDLSAASLCAVDVGLKWRPWPGAPYLELHADPKHAIAVRDLRWRTTPPTTLA